MTALQPNLTALADAFWAWRAVTQPLSGDDIPRIERPSGWEPEWSPDAIEQQRHQLQNFEADWRGLRADSNTWSRSVQVDYRLIGSALARVNYELDVVAGWRRNPHFYVHQTLGAVFELLLQPPPFSSARADELVRRAENMPATLDAARANLAGHAVRAFAAMAITALQDIGSRLKTVVRELKPFLTPVTAERFATAMARGATALE